MPLSTLIFALFFTATEPIDHGGEDGEFVSNRGKEGFIRLAYIIGAEYYNIQKR